MTDLEQQLTDHLRRRAAAATPRYDLEAIEQGTSLVSLVDLDDRRSRRPTMRTIVGLAAVVALVVAFAGVRIASDRDDPSRVTQDDGGWPHAAHTELFTDLAPGDHVALPPAPIEWIWPMAVWTGTELIVSDGATSGAAFDAANGTWRTIAPAPFAAGGQGSAVWTGTEMIVLGDFELGAVGGFEGAAYDPTSDTWRRLPDAPIGELEVLNPQVVWTGEELVLLGGQYPGPWLAAAVYDPDRDQWRQLADPPYDGILRSPVWTGTSVLAMAYEQGAGGVRRVMVVRYDVDTDTWTTVRDDDYVALIPAIDADGSVHSVLAVPWATGAPLDVLDRDGRVVDTLPAVPVNAERFDRIVLDGPATWVGGEIVLSAHGERPHTVNGLIVGPVRFDSGPSRSWALDPATRRWHQFAGGGSQGVAAGDVLFTWPGEVVAPESFVVHRMNP